MKWMFKLGKLALISVLAAVVATGATFYMIQAYVGQLLRTFHLEGFEAVSAVKMSDVLTGMRRDLLGMGSEETDTNASTDAKIVNGTVSPVGGGQTGTDSSDSAPAGERPLDEKYLKKPPEDALAVMGRVSRGSGSESEKQMLISSDDLNRKKESLSSEDKMKIFSILSGKLPQEEWQRLSAMMEDGITQQEMNEIDTVVKKYVSSDEYNEMVRILEKAT